MLTCPNCGRESPDDFTFCPWCGGPLAHPVRTHEVRKTVTVVFCDVTGSTAIGERLDPESLRRVMSRYFSEMRTALQRHGGTVEKFIGDAVVAVFGVPNVHEDDALRAIRAAGEMRESLRLLNRELERDHGVSLTARIGVNTGEVVTGDPTGEALVTGDAVNVAARLEQVATPGDVLIGDATLRLVRDAVVVEPVDPLTVKGKSAPVTAFRLIEVAEGAPGVARRLDSPMVGRDRQLDQIHRAYEAAVADRSCQLFTVLGTPGVGKSRLVEEAVTSFEGEAAILRGRCLPYGEEITFFPVGEVVKEAAGLEDFDEIDEIERKICIVLGDAEGGSACSTLAQLFGAADHQRETEEMFWAVRRFLESVAQRSPLVVVFDDIHWGESTFLDLIEHIADWAREAPILLLCMARPELLETRAAWGGGKLNAATISLEGLSDDECDVMIGNMLGRTPLPTEARDRILRSAEGTPMFVEEMLKMLIDDGVLRQEGNRWVASADLDDVPVPPTIQALIAARLDRLEPDERAVIERAAVAGKRFHLGAVRSMLDVDATIDVRATLMDLVRRDLIGPDRSLLSGEGAFRFRHLLIRDAAYEAASKALRAQLHRRFADWLADVAGDRVEEQEELVAYHLERSYRLQEELGPPDEAARVLAKEASRRLAVSAHRAAERGDEPAEASLLGRAADLLPADDPARPRLLYERARSLADQYEEARAFEAAADAVAAAAASGQVSLEWQGRILRTQVRQSMEPHTVSSSDVLVEVTEALSVFERLGDDVGLSTAWSRKAYTVWNACLFDDALVALEQATVHARRSGERRLLTNALELRSVAEMFGSTTPDAALASIEAIRSEVGSDGRVGHVTLTHEGVLRAMQGDLALARQLSEESIDMGERMGVSVWIAAACGFRGDLEQFSGDPAAAEPFRRREYESTLTLGHEGWRSISAAELSRVLCFLDRIDEAERFARIALDVAAVDDVATQAAGRCARALVCSARREHDEAIRLADEAMSLYANAQYPNGQGDAAMDAANVLRTAGREADAMDRAQTALVFFERKRNVPAIASAREFLGRAVA